MHFGQEFISVQTSENWGCINNSSQYKVRAGNLWNHDLFELLYELFLIHLSAKYVYATSE